MINNPWEFFRTHDIGDLKKKYHPDKHGGTKEACDRFANIMEAYKLSQEPQPIIGGHPVIREIARGDLRTIYSCNEGVVKCPLVNSKSAKKLIGREIKNLSTINKAAEGKTYTGYFPQILGLSDNCVLQSYGEQLVCLSDYIGQIGPRNIGWITNRFLVGLGFAHMNGLVHTAPTPEHMLVSDSHAGVLTGWIHGIEMGETISVVPSKYKSWYVSGQKADHTSDLKILGRSLEILGKNLPKRMANFIKSFQFVKDSAWDLQEDWSNLLGELFGPPKFVQLGEE